LHSTCQREWADRELSRELVGEISGVEAGGISGKAGEAGEAEAGGTSEAGVPLTGPGSIRDEFGVQRFMYMGK
jgi:hypothetical protein